MVEKAETARSQARRAVHASILAAARARLTEEGRRAAERKAQAHPDLWRQLKGGVEVLRQAGDLDYVRLSIAAKAFFLLNQKHAPVDERELPELAKSFGWAVSVDQIRDGLAYLRKLNLTSIPA